MYGLEAGIVVEPGGGERLAYYSVHVVQAYRAGNGTDLGGCMQSASFMTGCVRVSRHDDGLL